jgi:Mg2+-importing ATPase
MSFITGLFKRSNKNRGQVHDGASIHSWENLVGASNDDRENHLRYIAGVPSRATLSDFGTTREGLDEREVLRRLELVGPNNLSSKKTTPWWRLLLNSVFNPFNVLLGVIAIVSAIAPPPSWSTFAILVLMIFLSVGVRFWQEFKSSVEAVKLQAKVKTEIEVCRTERVNNEIHTVEKLVDKSDLVPGDIIMFNAGDNVPADCVILDSSYLQISQSALTGEAEPIRKSSHGNMEKNDHEAIFDLSNILFMGTVVVSGHGIGLVLATGDNAFIATITKELNKKRPLSAFEMGIRKVTYMMIIMMVIMVGTVLVIQGTRSKNWSQATLFSLSVAVGIVPEMLPAILNINLARGAYQLSKKRAIVRRLDAVQNLGGMTVLCSDKTGTLTKDEISLHKAEDFHGSDSLRVLRLAYTNAMNQGGKKNSIDEAILNKGRSQEKLIPIGEKVIEIPFNFEKRRSTAIVRDEYGQLSMICKGAFEEILSLCTRIRLGDNIFELDEAQRHRLLQKANDYNEKGYRVLAVATNHVDPIDIKNEKFIEYVENYSILEGLLTFLDPPKDDAAESIAALQASGVEVKVLTGDSLRIAANVCRSLNLHGPDPEIGIHSVTGPELAQMGPEDFKEMVKRCTIFAKLTPKQKGEVIKCLKLDGHAVGMLGDGINDCVALRMADVGISVNTAVNVAKDCADIILTEKDLSIIVDGVKIGRLTHGNTMKYIKMVTSSNFGNCLSVLIASAWLPYQPMMPIQIIIQNLLYDISQTALPWDHMDEEYLAVPHRWDIKDLLRFILVFGPTSSTIDMITFCLNWFYYGIKTANSPLVSQAQTHFFLEGLLTQTLIVHMFRTAKLPFIQSCASSGLVITTSLISVVGLVVTYIPPIARLIHLVRPASSFLGFLGAQLVIYCIEVQVTKMLYIKIFKIWL